MHKILGIILLSTLSLSAQTISGELQKWHKITLDFEGPQSSELANPNPFTFYRLDAVFTHESGSPVMQVPGYYAADGNAENTSGNSGNIWRIHFSAPKAGKWHYEVSFKGGEGMALKQGGESAGFMDGTKGDFNVSASNKKGIDNRAKGKLAYVGTRYLQFQETKDYFLKAGADSPENMLHYSDFDGTLDGYGKLGKDYLQLMKDWAPHAKDFEEAAMPYTWKNGKGKNILGAVNYLSGLGVNAFSFLTFSVDGDDGCVYPHLATDDALFIETSQQSKSWEKAMHQDRFDVSKLAQWEKVFDYAETKGMFLHFKTFENENSARMGIDKLTMARKLYYRELIARFGHHLALNWNLSEETKVTLNVIKETASFIRNLDPYKSHVVQHTFPPSHKRDAIPKRPNYDYYYNNLVGFQSELTGASLQLHKDEIHREVKKWIELSEASGKPWVICNDEQGTAGIGVSVDASHASYLGKVPDNEDQVRNEVLWGTFMAGGMGVEYYYGYKCESNDLNAEDHRSRENKYKQAIIALEFFNTYLPFNEMKSADELTSNENDYVFAKKGEVYSVYLPAGEIANIELPKGKWQIQWFNPTIGGKLSAKKRLNSAGTLTAPDSEDWVALVSK